MFDEVATIEVAAPILAFLEIGKQESRKQTEIVSQRGLRSRSPASERSCGVIPRWGA
jgi:hypothetical protein